MSDEKQNEELEEQEGSPLPAREMMSLLSTSPASGLSGIGGVEPAPGPMPLDQTDGIDRAAPYAPPASGDEMHTMDGDGVSAEPRSETITQSDSASSET